MWFRFVVVNPNALSGPQGVSGGGLLCGDFRQRRWMGALGKLSGIRLRHRDKLHPPVVDTKVLPIPSCKCAAGKFLTYSRLSSASRCEASFSGVKL